ncbi:MAG TPA: cytochrome c oxidase subunit II [Dissulfurispiraceae bacterium]|nr:cytochrome c oxidase subunit II [Dissulfurispiraceae bacterium]
MFPGPANTTGKVEEPFFYIVAVAVVLLIIVTASMIVFVLKYNRSRHPEPEHVRENVWLEVFWTAVPTALAVSMFYFGWVNFEFLRTPPKDAMLVDVIARQWSWTFQYENGKKSDALRVPLNKPVKLRLTSEDVIHSLFIPAFRIKEDCVPGMKTHLWFQASEAGSYDIFCTEYCGVGHAHMLAKVIVMPPEEYEKWYGGAEASGLAALGQQIAQTRGCTGCHSTDGSRRIGPTFKGLLGKKEAVVTNGQEREITVDAEYIKNYVRHPNIDVIKGYPPIMPAIDMTDEDLDKVIAYIGSLK